MPEVYKDSVEYCNPHSVESIKAKIELLLSNNLRIEELKIKGFENIKKYDWQASSNKFIEIIESVLYKHKKC